MPFSMTSLSPETPMYQASLDPFTQVTIESSMPDPLLEIDLGVSLAAEPSICADANLAVSLSVDQLQQEATILQPGDPYIVQQTLDDQPEFMKLLQDDATVYINNHITSFLTEDKSLASDALLYREELKTDARIETDSSVDRGRLTDELATSHNFRPSSYKSLPESSIHLYNLPHLSARRSRGHGSSSHYASCSVVDSRCSCCGRSLNADNWCDACRLSFCAVCGELRNGDCCTNERCFTNKDDDAGETDHED